VSYLCYSLLPRAIPWTSPFSFPLPSSLASTPAFPFLVIMDCMCTHAIHCFSCFFPGTGALAHACPSVPSDLGQYSFFFFFPPLWNDSFDAGRPAPRWFPPRGFVRLPLPCTRIPVFVGEKFLNPIVHLVSLARLLIYRHLRRSWCALILRPYLPSACAPNPQPF